MILFLVTWWEVLIVPWHRFYVSIFISVRLHCWNSLRIFIVITQSDCWWRRLHFSLDLFCRQQSFVDPTECKSFRFIDFSSLPIFIFLSSFSARQCRKRNQHEKYQKTMTNVFFTAHRVLLFARWATERNQSLIWQRTIEKCKYKIIIRKKRLEFIKSSYSFLLFRDGKLTKRQKKIR